MRRALWLCFATSLVLACGGSDGSDDAPAPDVEDVGIGESDADDAGTPPTDADPLDVATPDLGSDAGTGADTAPGADVDARADSAFEPEVRFLTVDLEPARAVYRTGTLVTPRATLLFDDGTEAVAEETEVVWSTRPQTEPPESGPRWRIDGEGTLTFVGCFVGSTEPEICGERTIQVDQAAPQITILEPTPGAELGGDGATSFFVRGRVQDTNGEARVFINGVASPLTAGGLFERRVTPQPGVVHIEVEATDGLQASPSRAALDVLWAADYRAPVGATDGSGEGAGIARQVNDALVLSFGQPFIDDGVPLGVPDETGALRTEDLVGILEWIVRELDLDTLVPDPVVDTGDIVLRIERLTLGDPLISLDLRSGGLEAFVRFDAVQLTTEGALNVSGVDVSLDGGIVAGLSARATIAVEKASASDPLEVSIGEVGLALEYADAAFDAPEANAVFALAEGALFGAVEGLLLDLVNDAVLDAIPDLLDGVLRGLDALLVGQSLPLDLGFGTPLTLGFDLPLSRVETVRSTRLAASLDASVTVDSEPSWPESRGVPLLVALGTEPPYLPNSRVQAMVDTAFLNAVLHALWDAGLLRIPLDDLLPAELAFLVDGAAIDGRLPPILTRGTPEDGGGDVLLSVGQLELSLTRGEQVDVFGLLLRAAVDISLDGGVLSIALPPAPEVVAWTVSVGGDTPIFADSDAIEGLVTSLVWPELAGAIGDSLSIELPTFDLGAVGSFAPSLSGLTLELVLDREIVLQSGYVVLDGALEGTTP